MTTTIANCSLILLVGVAVDAAVNAAVDAAVVIVDLTAVDAATIAPAADADAAFAVIAGLLRVQ